MSKPDLELALDLRSYEDVVVLGSPDPRGYPTAWRHFDSITQSCVVIVDRIDVSPRLLSDIGIRRPRLVALVPQGVDQEKSMRRMLSSSYPWSEVWTVSSSFGKLLVTKDVVGSAYDRDSIRDERTLGKA